MKKLIAISVVFALVAGVAFAMDVGGTVIGTVNVLESSTAEGAEITPNGGLSRIRIDGGGEANENFGGYFRADDGAFYGNAWWKPIDQFKLLIGSNGYDGFIGKEGNTGWMFQQTPTDTKVTFGGGNVWEDGGLYGFGITTRAAFFEGGGDGAPNQVYLFITPAEIASINVILPLFSPKAGKDGATIAYAFKEAVFQLDLNLDFGNIAVTYQGNLLEGYDQPTIYGYFGGSFGDLSLDVGLGFTMPNEDSTSNPIGVGLGLKYATDAFGVKFRTVASLAGEDKATKLLADVLPYFSLSDNLAAFVSVGIGMVMPESGDSLMGWHFNPYLQIGEEWGAKFLAGIKVWSAGKTPASLGEPDENGIPTIIPGQDAIIHWAVPIAIIVSF